MFVFRRRVMDYATVVPVAQRSCADGEEPALQGGKDDGRAPVTQSTAKPAATAPSAQLSKVLTPPVPSKHDGVSARDPFMH
jgi:hypothetical protein